MVPVAKLIPASWLTLISRVKVFLDFLMTYSNLSSTPTHVRVLACGLDPTEVAFLILLHCVAAAGGHSPPE